jgi:hypothetical protein
MRDLPRRDEAPDEGERPRVHAPERTRDGFDHMEKMLRMRDPDGFDVGAFRRRAADIRNDKPERSDKTETPDRLPEAERAIIDQRKFTHYSMNPDAANNGKWKAWPQVGYDIDNRRHEAADDVRGQLRKQLTDAPVVDTENSDYGPRYTTESRVDGSNGKRGTLVSVWQFDKGSDAPRMLTNWLEVHTEKGER